MPRHKRCQPAPNYSSPRQKRGEQFLNYMYVRRVTSLVRLIQPTRLVYDLALLSDGTSHRDVCDAFLDQYRWARDEYDNILIEKMRNQARAILCTK